MAFNIERLKAIAKQPNPQDVEFAEFRKKNNSWLMKSAMIALEIRRHLRVNRISQTRLANLLEVSPAQVTKLLSGNENLGLKTICKIEDVLGLELVNVNSPKGAFSVFTLIERNKNVGNDFTYSNESSYRTVVPITNNTFSKYNNVV